MTSSPPRTADARAPLEAKPVFDWLFWLAVLAVVALYVRAIYFTPIDALQGAAQKIYYVHIAGLAAGVHRDRRHGADVGRLSLAARRARRPARAKRAPRWRWCF